MPDYRYILIREWLTGAGTCLWIGLNPASASDAPLIDDMTSRKFVGFSKRWGFRRMVACNLYGMRTKDPKQLLWTIEKEGRNIAEGPDNLGAIEVALASSDLIVAAWGAFALAAEQADSIPCLKARPLYCIGKTKGGYPLHPSRAGYTAAPVLFREAE